MDSGHFNTGNADPRGGCFTCRWPGPQPLQFGPLQQQWMPYETWLAEDVFEELYRSEGQ